MGFIHKVKSIMVLSKTIPNSLRQLPVKNLIIHEAALVPICFKGLIYYKKVEEFF